MKRVGDKAEVRAAIVRAAAMAHPGVLERADLDTEPAIARADGRTVTGEIKRLVHSGCLASSTSRSPAGECCGSRRRPRRPRR